MIAFGYTECGLSIDQFFMLSFYEWSLEVEKVRRRNERDFNIWEGHAALSRQLMAAVMNSAGKSYKKLVDPRELISLSFDKAEKQAERVPKTDKEMKQKFGRKFIKNG